MTPSYVVAFDPGGLLFFALQDQHGADARLALCRELGRPILFVLAETNFQRVAVQFVDAQVRSPLRRAVGRGQIGRAAASTGPACRSI
jgi:hypothetical protein